MYECKREKACGKTTSHTHTERDLCEASRGSGVTAVTTCVFDVASLASLPPSLSSLLPSPSLSLSLSHPLSPSLSLLSSLPPSPSLQDFLKCTHTKNRHRHCNNQLVYLQPQKTSGPSVKLLPSLSLSLTSPPTLSPSLSLTSVLLSMFYTVLCTTTCIIVVSPSLPLSPLSLSPYHITHRSYHFLYSANLTILHLPSIHFSTCLTDRLCVHFA